MPLLASMISSDSGVRTRLRISRVTRSSSATRIFIFSDVVRPAAVRVKGPTSNSIVRCARILTMRSAGYLTVSSARFVTTSTALARTVVHPSRRPFGRASRSGEQVRRTVAPDLTARRWTRPIQHATESGVHPMPLPHLRLATVSLILISAAIPVRQLPNIDGRDEGRENARHDARSDRRRAGATRALPARLRRAPRRLRARPVDGGGSLDRVAADA